MTGSTGSRERQGRKCEFRNRHSDKILCKRTEDRNADCWERILSSYLPRFFFFFKILSQNGLQDRCKMTDPEVRVYKSGQEHVFLDFLPSVLSTTSWYHLTTRPELRLSRCTCTYLFCLSNSYSHFKTQLKCHFFGKAFMLPSSRVHGIILCNDMIDSNPFSIYRAFFPPLNQSYIIRPCSTMFGTY